MLAVPPAEQDNISQNRHFFAVPLAEQENMSPRREKDRESLRPSEIIRSKSGEFFSSTSGVPRKYVLSLRKCVQRLRQDQKNNLEKILPVKKKSGEKNRQSLWW